MKIGIDFDNTIACYDGVFHKAAIERELIPADLPTDKTSVRDYLRAQGKEDDWTILQGYVYGARMDLVKLYEGFRHFLNRAIEQGHDCIVISHKTRTPYMGPEYDLHKSARDFLHTHNLAGDNAPLNDSKLFFEITFQKKLERIAERQCDVFIDDLPELITDASFPDTTSGILFDPDNHHGAKTFDGNSVEIVSAWSDIELALLSGPNQT